MNAHIPVALLQGRELQVTRATASGVEIELSRQLRVRYDRATRTIWSHWRPAPRPCFNTTLLADISTYYDFLARSGARIECWGESCPIEYVLLASATPGVFNLGGDLDLFKQLIDTHDETGLLRYGRACIEVLYRNYLAHDLPVTTISLVQGECLGGGFEAALSSDLIVAERASRFGFPEVLFNLFPGMGAYSFLERKIGQLRANELIASGRICSAEEMHALGVVDELAEDGHGEAAVTRLITHRQRSRNGLAALAAARRRVQQIQFSELLDVVRIWVDATFRLTSRDLRLMQHLVSRQNSLAGSLCSTHLQVCGDAMLRDALDQDRLVLFSQPVIRLADGRPVHHEIMVRIRNSDGGYVLPGNFIGRAESLNLIQEVDLRVVDSLLRHMAHNGQNERKLRYFVNLSRKSISDRHWIARLTSLVRASSVDPGQLVFELNETAAMSEVDVTLAFVRRLKDMGCRFGLDGLGTRSSSLRHLKWPDVDYLKIDGRLVRNLATNKRSQALARTLSDKARRLHRQVIAQWVESPGVLKALLEAGAEYGQGNLFQPPQPLTVATQGVNIPPRYCVSASAPPAPSPESRRPASNRDMRVTAALEATPHE